MSTNGYTIYYVERAKTRAEQRAADAQLGRRAAAVAQLCRSLARPVRALRHRSSPGPAARPACASASNGG